MVSQPTNRLDFAEIMDTGQVFSPKLRRAKSARRTRTSRFLLVSKLQQTGMSRQAQEAECAVTFAYIDEFHHFSTRHGEILGGRAQIPTGAALATKSCDSYSETPEVARAVMNCGTRVGCASAMMIAKTRRWLRFFEARRIFRIWRRDRPFAG